MIPWCQIYYFLSFWITADVVIGFDNIKSIDDDVDDNVDVENENKDEEVSGI